jgi:serine/threonine-protein kinase
MIVRVIKISGLVLAFFCIAGLSAYFTITLIIKSGETVIVPDLQSGDVVAVLELLTGLGLNTKVKGYEYSATVAKNHIIAQDPKPGTEIKKGRDVRVIISRGSRTILMPNLKGLELRRAELIIEENDLQRGVISLAPSAPIARHHIIAQTPVGGASVTRGEGVHLLVSTGIRPQAHRMAELRGLTPAEAIRRVEVNRLVIGEMRYRFDPQVPRNIVVEQQPPSGHRVEEGSPVTLVVNRSPGAPQDAPADGGTAARLFRHRTGYGFLNRHVRVRMLSEGLTFDLFDDFVKPAREIRLLVPGDTRTTLFLYEDGELVETKVFGTG